MYYAQFQNSLGDQTQRIRGQLALALADLQASNERSAAVQAAMPQALQQSYQGALGSLDQASTVAQQATGGMGRAGGIDQLRAMLQSNTAASASAAPLMTAMREAALSARQATLRSAGAQAEGNIDSQRNDMMKTMWQDAYQWDRDQWRQQQLALQAGGGGGGGGG